MSTSLEAFQKSVPAAAPLRLGAVSYLNTLPMVEGLGKLSNLALTLTAPAKLIDLLLEGRIDAGLISLIDHQRSPEPLALLPVGMIASEGATMTVRLFSSRPLAKIEDVQVDADSHTSVALMRLILARMYGVRPRVREVDVESTRPGRDGGDAPQAVLLIGDKVVTSAPMEERYPIQVDLGEQWRAMTGLPFVYAMWMCRLADAEAPWVAEVAAILDRQRRHNATRLDWIAATRAPVRGWTRDRAAAYFGESLQYDVQRRHREAVDRFFDLCAEESLIPHRRPTVWIDG